MKVIERLTAAEIQLRSPPGLLTAAAWNHSLQHEAFACISSHSLSVPCRSTNRVFLLSQVFSSQEFCAFVTFSSPGVVCRALPHSLRASPHRTFPQLNLRTARVRRNRGRLPSNGFIERAPEHRARAHFFSESAPPIKHQRHSGTVREVTEDGVADLW